MKHKPTTHDLYERIILIRNKLPKQYTEPLIDRNPSLIGKEVRIRKVVGLQTTDETITIALEKLVKSL